jgi:hypothetical protein
LIRDSFTCAPWLIHMWDMTWQIHTCDMTRIDLYTYSLIRDAITRVPWLIHMWNMTWQIHTCDMTHIHLHTYSLMRDSFTCVPGLMCVCVCLIYMCAMTHSRVGHDMTDSYVWHDSYSICSSTRSTKQSHRSQFRWSGAPKIECVPANLTVI